MGSTTGDALDSALQRAYGVALAAAADDEAAGEAVARVFAADPSGWRELGEDELLARVALSAVRLAPHPAWLMVACEDREALVLARLLGWPASRIADALLIDAAEVRSRLARALRSIAGARLLAAAA